MADLRPYQYASRRISAMRTTLTPRPKAELLEATGARWRKSIRLVWLLVKKYLAAIYIPRGLPDTINPLSVVETEEGDDDEGKER